MTQTNLDLVSTSAPQAREPQGAAVELARAQLWPIVLWAVALPATWYWGEWLGEQGYDLVLAGSQPFLGGFNLEIEPGILMVLALAAAAVIYLPTLAQSLGWRPLLVTGWLAASAWTLALTTVRGTEDLTLPLTKADDYLRVVPLADADLSEFVATFTDDILDYPTHVKGHPPGLVVFLTLLARIGVTSDVAIALMYVFVGTSALAAVAVTVKILAGEEMFRRAMPVVVVVPAAVWIGTSPDAFFAGALAWGVAFLAMAHRNLWWALPGGVLLGMCPFLSYGLLPMGVILLAVVFVQRDWIATAVCAGVALLVPVGWALAGFTLYEGIFATQTAWELDAASVRPYWYFAIANLVVLATLVGPAALAGLPGSGSLPAPVKWLIWLALFGALFGSLSGYMRGEVERIWLPLVYWIALAAAVPGPRRRWVAASVPVALACQIFIASQW